MLELSFYLVSFSSRHRFSGEVGIYISIYDAIATDSKSFGLEHFFFMKTTELLYNECRNTDLVKIRAALVQRGVLKDCYVERFEPGRIYGVFI